jgi:hypothetical protein
MFGFVFLTAGALAVVVASLRFSHGLMFVKEATSADWIEYYLDTTAFDFEECLVSVGAISITAGFVLLAGSAIPVIRRRRLS